MHRRKKLYEDLLKIAEPPYEQGGLANYTESGNKVNGSNLRVKSECELEGNGDVEEMAHGPVVCESVEL